MTEYALFADNSKKIRRLLQRATEQNLREQARQFRSVGSISQQLETQSRAATRIANAFTKAIKTSNVKIRLKESIRMTAPGTGGRSFHTHRSTVTATGKRGTSSGASPMLSSTRSSAHMNYIERVDAIERIEITSDDTLGNKNLNMTRNSRIAEDGKAFLPDVEQLIVNPVTMIAPAQTAAAARLNENSLDKFVDAELGVRPQAMQNYIERDGAGETSAADGHSLDFSFGTIGASRAERHHFWNLVEKHITKKNAVLQHRVILELPHEVRPEVRLAIMKAYTKRYEDEGIPFWAVLHAPTAKNDPRNYHAHVVHLARPAKLILHPEGGDDGLLVDGLPKRFVPTWDFAAFTNFTDANKNKRIRYPFRQQATERGLHYAKDERRRFAEVVNEQLIKAGSKIRYDHRSYAKMGINTAKIGRLSQQALAQTKSNKSSVEDSGLSQRSLQWIAEKLARKQIKFVQKIDAALEKLPKPLLRGVKPTQIEQIKRRREFVKPEYNISPFSDATCDDILERKRAALLARRACAKARVQADLEQAKIEHVIKMTDPAHHLETADKLKSKDITSSRQKAFLKDRLEELPDLGTLAIIHQSARQELEEHLTSAARIEKLFSSQAYAAKQAMREFATRGLTGYPGKGIFMGGAIPVMPVTREIIRIINDASGNEKKMATLSGRLIEVAKAYGELRRMDPGNEAFKISPEAAALYGLKQTIDRPIQSEVRVPISRRPEAGVPQPASTLIKAEEETIKATSEIQIIEKTEKTQKSDAGANPSVRASSLTTGVSGLKPEQLLPPPLGTIPPGLKTNAPRNSSPVENIPLPAKSSVPIKSPSSASAITSKTSNAISGVPIANIPNARANDPLKVQTAPITAKPESVPDAPSTNLDLELRARNAERKKKRRKALLAKKNGFER